jgi:hypothetical protein
VRNYSFNSFFYLIPNKIKNKFNETLMAKYIRSSSQETLTTSQTNSKERLNQLEVLVKRVVKKQNDKESVVEIGQCSTQSINQTTAPNEKDESANSNTGIRVEKIVAGTDRGITGMHRTNSEEIFQMNQEEYH